MNWKFTKVKIIVSVILGILLYLFASPALSRGFGIISLIGFLIGFGLTYLIWSLIQKKVNTDDKTLNTEK